MQLLNDKDKRLLLAIGISLVFFTVIFGALVPWAASLSLLGRWLVVALIIALMLVMICAICVIMDPIRVTNAVREHKIKRATRRGTRIHERELTPRYIDKIKRKYPGVF